MNARIFLAHSLCECLFLYIRLSLLFLAEILQHLPWVKKRGSCLTQTKRSVDPVAPPSEITFGPLEGPSELYIASILPGGAVNILNVVTQQTMTYHEHNAEINSIAWAPDGTRIASAGKDAAVHIWDPLTGKRETTFMLHRSEVLSLTWSADGTKIASAGKDAIFIWNPIQGCELLHWQQDPSCLITKLAWSPEADELLGVSANQSIHKWREDGSHCWTITRGNPSTIVDIVWSPRTGHNLFATASSDGISLWDALTGEHIFTYEGHVQADGNRILGCRWTPDGKEIISADTKSIHQWPVPDWWWFTPPMVFTTMPNPLPEGTSFDVSAPFHEPGKQPVHLLAFAGNGRIAITDTPFGQFVREFDPSGGRREPSVAS